ncbi:MAG TPA: dUTP diphosphatase [Acholeplasmataceae bacterium]|nr:dUTP diphosphatase [Acholeplasmataceae bacterium]
MRRFEVVSKYVNQKVNLPVRASKDSAGYDFEVIENVEIMPGEIKLVPTGVKALMPKSEVLLVFPRSSLGMKKGLMMSNGVGVIDADYYYSENEGHIMIPLYNFTQNTVKINAYERVAQGIFTNFYKTTGDDDNHTVRLGGFGSSGK